MDRREQAALHPLTRARTPRGRINAEGGRTPAPELLKQWLDDNGLEAEGNEHSFAN